MPKKLLFCFFALILWLTIFVFIKATLALFTNTILPINGNWTYLLELLAFISGFILWLGLYSSSPKFLKSYVLSHELTHLIWALFMGSNVKQIKVGTTQGKVVVTELNPFIALAPYFFPLYTVIALILYGIALLFWNYKWIHIAFALVFGLTLSYHYTFTFKSLYQGQSDIKLYGAFFSYALIFCMNIIVIDILLILFTPATTMDFLIETINGTKWLICNLQHLTKIISQLMGNYLTR